MFHIPTSFDVFSVKMKSDFMWPVSTLHNALQDKIFTVFILHEKSRSKAG